MEVIIGFTVIGTVMFTLINAKEEKPPESNPGKTLEDAVRAIKEIWSKP
jgi:hypothetical protein